MAELFVCLECVVVLRSVYTKDTIFIKILSTYDVIPLDSCGSLLLPLARLTRRRGILG